MAVAHGNVAGLLRKHDYTELKKVGEGSFGKAILVQGGDGSRLICKMVDVSKASRKEMEDAIKESKLLAELKHPYIVRYRESFTDCGWLCIIMDYCEGGDLTAQIQNSKRRREPIPEDRVLKWFTQAIMALKYIHDKHILHRDLKPSNFFLSKGGSLKMGDFGIAKVLACTIAVAKTQIGTPYYLSPELCQEKPYAWPSDIWSMGCILYELTCLRVPFDAPSIAGLVQKIVRGPIPSVPNTYSAFVVQLCGEMLNRIPDRRPGTADILERPKIKAMVDQMVEEASEAMPAERAPGAAASSASSAVSAGGATPYEASAGTFKKGDLVEYYSSSHKDWLPATVTSADDGGRIIIDLKPSTWITKAEQASKIRPRGGGAAAARNGGGAAPVRAASPSPMMRRSPSLQRCPSGGPGAERNTPRGAAQRRPSLGGGGGAGGGGGFGARPASRAASPSHGAGGAVQRSPSIGAFGGGAGGPPSRGASPMLQRSPSQGAAGDRPWCASPMRQRSPSVGSVNRAGGASVYRKGDLIEYYSPSHKDWLPAVVANVDGDGRIIIDLKPNTWLSKEDQSSRVRRRGAGAAGGGAAIDRPGSRGRAAAPVMQRSPSAGGLAFGTPRAQTPSRAASPWRGSSRDPPPNRAASPMHRYSEAGAGTPRLRPGLPPGIPKASDSPLRNGGRFIAGAV